MLCQPSGSEQVVVKIWVWPATLEPSLGEFTPLFGARFGGGGLPSHSPARGTSPDCPNTTTGNDADEPSNKKNCAVALRQLPTVANPFPCQSPATGLKSSACAKLKVVSCGPPELLLRRNQV